MSMISIFGLLALLSVLHPSIQGQVWPLKGAEVGYYNYRKYVSLERKDDGETYFIHAISEFSNATEPRIVHGPFKLRGFGPYSMFFVKIWLNTDKYVSVTFHDPTVAREFYHILNPHHSPTFLNSIEIKELVVHSVDGIPTRKFEEDLPKALDIFILETSNRVDSRARSYVVHNMEGNQEPILIFHSSEVDIAVINDNYVLLTIFPLNSPKKYRVRMTFDDPSVAKRLRNAHTTLTSLGCETSLPDLEALDINTYPSRPMLYDQGESSNSGTQSRDS